MGGKFTTVLERTKNGIMAANSITTTSMLLKTEDENDHDTRFNLLPGCLY